MPIDLSSLIPLAQSAHGEEGGGARDIIDHLARTPLSQVVLFVAVLTVIRLVVFPKLLKTPIHLRSGGFYFLKIINEVVDAFVYAGVFVFLIIRPFVVQAFLIPSGSMWPTLDINDFIVANKAIYRYSDPHRGDIVVFRPPVAAILDPTQLDSSGQPTVDYIKRCIGLPGDVIELKKGILYRNGTKVDEPYIHYSETTDNGKTFTDLTKDVEAKITKPNFKWIKWKGKLLPLSYTDYDANSFAPRGAFPGDHPYMVAGEFGIADPDDQAVAKTLPAQPIPQGFYMMMGDNRNNSFDGRAWGLVPRDSIVGRAECIWLPITRWRITR